MKCMSRRRALPSDVRTAAINVAKQMLDEQSDRISARCYNEVCVAMLQCNLSPRTIDRVQNVLKEAVLPKLDELYTPPRKTSAILTTGRTSPTPICGSKTTCNPTASARSPPRRRKRHETCDEILQALRQNHAGRHPAKARLRYLPCAQAPRGR